jgi:CBS domain-containing protein
MAIRVHEVMNRELFSVSPEESVESALQAILALGITGAAVVDEHGVPLGHISLRDLVRDRAGKTARDRMTRPAATVSTETRIAEAARRLAKTGYHRLIVVDASGRAVGMVSSLDVIRGLLGLPAPHPAAFPHLDSETGLSWSDDLPLGPEDVDAALDGPGVLVLLSGDAGVADRVVWAESSERLRSRLKEMLTTAQPEPLAAWLEHGRLRFRVASAPEPAERADALAIVLRRAAAAPRPDFVWRSAAS